MNARPAGTFAIVACFFFVLPLAPVARPALAATYQFGTDVQVSHSNYPLEAHATGHHNIAARGGRIFVLWHEDHGGRIELHLAVSTDGGASFPLQQRVDTSETYGIGEYSMAVSSDGRTVHVVWNALAPGGSVMGIWYARSTDGGQTFGANRLVALYYTNPIFRDPSPQVAIGPASLVYILYYAGWNADEPAYLMRSDDGGAHFTAPWAIEEMRPRDPYWSLTENPGLAVSAAGRITLSYGETFPDAYHADYLASDDGGNVFSGPGDWSAGEYSASICYDGGGRLYVSSTEEHRVTSTYDPVVDWSDDGGVSFAGGAALDPGQLAGYQTTSVAATGRIVGVAADRPQAGEVAIRVSEESGANFSPWFRANDGPAGYDASLAFDENADAYLMWVDWRSGSRQIWFDRGRATLSVGVPSLPVTPPAAAAPARLAAWPNPSRGEVTLAFPREGAALGDETLLQVRIYDALGRAIRSGRLMSEGQDPLAFRWDGRDDRGRPAAPGVYYARVVGADDLRAPAAETRFVIAR